jgi:hypothetical protein
MREIGLRVAGMFFAVTAMAAPNLAPAILTFPELKALEVKVAAHPEDRESAALLGQNYAVAITGVTELSPYNTPTKFGALGEAAAYSRTAVAQSHSGAVLGPTGRALVIYTRRLPGLDSNEAQDLALSCIERAIEIEPAKPSWRQQHIALIIMREQFPRWRPLDSAAALALVEPDLAEMKGNYRSAVLGGIALQAYRAGNLNRAAALAQELLATAKSPKDWGYGNAIFKGNEVLGLIALKHRDLAGAKTYLKLSAEMDGSPVLKSFGPNMALAAGLLDAGEKEAVAAFLEQCKTFWKMDNGKLREWQVLVQGGVKPNFGANLNY